MFPRTMTKPDKARVTDRADSNKALKVVVGDRFRAARKINGWDQTEAADKFGYKNSTQISLIEDAKRLPPHAVFINASKIYGVSLDYLYGLSDEPERDPRAAERHAALRQMHGIIQGTTDVVVAQLQRYLTAGAPSVMAARAVLSKADDVIKAIDRFYELNREAMDEDMRGSNTLLKTKDALETALIGAKELLARHDRVGEEAISTAERRAGISRPLFDGLPANA